MRYEVAWKGTVAGVERHGLGSVSALKMPFKFLAKGYAAFIEAIAPSLPMMEQCSYEVYDHQRGEWL